MVRPSGSVATKRCGMPASSSRARAMRIQSAALPLCAVGFATSTAGAPRNHRAIPTGRFVGGVSGRSVPATAEWYLRVCGVGLRMHELPHAGSACAFWPAIELGVRSVMVGLVVPPSITDEHEMLRQTLRQFVQSRVEPQAMEHDQSATFNAGLLA